MRLPNLVILTVFLAFGWTGWEPAHSQVPASKISRLQSLESRVTKDSVLHKKLLVAVAKSELALEEIDFEFIAYVFEKIKILSPAEYKGYHAQLVDKTKKTAMEISVSEFPDFIAKPLKSFADQASWQVANEFLFAVTEGSNTRMAGLGALTKYLMGQMRFHEVVEIFQKNSPFIMTTPFSVSQNLVGDFCVSVRIGGHADRCIEILDSLKVRDSNALIWILLKKVDALTFLGREEEAFRLLKEVDKSASDLCQSTQLPPLFRNDILMLSGVLYRMNKKWDQSIACLDAVRISMGDWATLFFREYELSKTYFLMNRKKSHSLLEASQKVLPKERPYSIFNLFIEVEQAKHHALNASRPIEARVADLEKIIEKVAKFRFVDVEKGLIFLKNNLVNGQKATGATVPGQEPFEVKSVRLILEPQ